ncbi:MAG: hypothetical protein HY664_00725 [Chloroflexi bacterium]|nr:hypothetical protein [Chloroflexota bacterium]
MKKKIGIFGMLVVAALLAFVGWWNTVAGASETTNATVKVEVTAGRNDNSIAYQVTLINNTSATIGPLYIAADVPSGTKFGSATATPSGSWFKGVEGNSAIWLSNGVPAKSKLGPFTYKVTATTTAVGTAHAWIHWTGPTDGTAVSANVSADYQLIKVRGVNTRVDHEKYPAGKVALTTTAGKGHQEDEIVTSGLPNVGVGDYVYLEGANQDSLENSITGWQWNLLDKPEGSQAALEGADTQTPRFLTDRVGEYVVRLVTTNEKGQSASSAITVTAGTYAGVSLCASCHDGSLAEDMVSKWAETGHGTKFETTYSSYTPERDYCIRCHTVGYNETANNGGMDDAARASGWDPAKNGSVLAWLKKGGKTIEDVKADPNMASKINIQCENCHGPGATAHTETKSYDPAVCGQCHPQPSQWQYAGHAKIDPHMATNPSCAKCHTGQGYVEVNIKGKEAIFPDAATAAKPANIPSLEQQSGISCAACHDSHSFTHPEEGKSKQLRTEGEVKTAMGWSTDAGVAATCVKCHANNRTPANLADFIAGTRTRGTHENTQADVFYGKGYYDYGGAIKVTNSAHTTLAKDACVTCHMAAQPKVDNVTVDSVGGHSFNMEAEWKGKEVENTGACAACHGTTTTFNRPAAGDYDGDGKMEGVQDEVKGLLALIAAKLPKDAEGNVLESTWTTANSTDAQRKAAWNYQLIVIDGSNGIHNTSFTVQLLQQTYKQLTDTDVPGATLR